MSFRNELVDYVCDSTQYLRAMSILMIFFGVLSALSLIVGEPGTAAYVLSIVNFVIAVAAITAFVGIFYYCRQRPDAY